MANWCNLLQEQSFQSIHFALAAEIYKNVKVQKKIKKEKDNAKQNEKNKDENIKKHL